VIVTSVIMVGNFYCPKRTVSKTDYSKPMDFSSSFTQFYDQNLNYVYRYISYRIQDKNVVADLTSTVFEKALAAFRSYDERKASPQTWLIAIARNTLTDYFRESSRKQTVALDEALQVETRDPSLQEQSEKNEEYEVLKICISILPPREQEIVSMKFGGELNNRNIAAALKLSDSNVGIILFRAIQKLRECFQGWLNGKRPV
jgi:RNA polymerase sigma factor (sigma-70 family)